MPEAAKCPLCEKPDMLTTAAEHAMQACSSCATKIGIIPMPPSRRPAAPCARCSSLKFVRVIPREHSTTRSGEMNAQVSAPMYVTHSPDLHRGWLINRVNEVEIEKKGVGLLETYICAKCGAVEWYCVDVEKIPIHPHLMTEEVDYAGETPYR